MFEPNVRVIHTITHRKGTFLGSLNGEYGTVNYDKLGVKAYQPLSSLTLLSEKANGERTRKDRKKEPTVSEQFMAHLRIVGVDIRPFCAEEHIPWLENCLRSAGRELPYGFEHSDTHSRGGVTRPLSYGIECTFEVPPFDVPHKFRARKNRTTYIARTAFALQLLRAGFVPTTWKGKKSTTEVLVCQEASL